MAPLGMTRMGSCLVISRARWPASITGSVFGIATKSELEAAMAREAQTQRVVEGRLEALDGRLATVAEDLDRFEQRLQPELVRLDSTVARNAREMELITARWAGVREQLKADVDSLRASHALVMDEVVWLRDDLDLARGDITRMGARADHADGKAFWGCGCLHSLLSCSPRGPGGGRQGRCPLRHH